MLAGVLIARQILAAVAFDTRLHTRAPCHATDPELLDLVFRPHTDLCVVDRAVLDRDPRITSASGTTGADRDLLSSKTQWLTSASMCSFRFSAARF